jgi:hypothetical protein
VQINLSRRFPKLPGLSSPKLKLKFRSRHADFHKLLLDVLTEGYDHFGVLPQLRKAVKKLACGSYFWDRVLVASQLCGISKLSVSNLVATQLFDITTFCGTTTLRRQQTWPENESEISNRAHSFPPPPSLPPQSDGQKSRVRLFRGMEGLVCRLNLWRIELFKYMKVCQE